MHNPIPWPDGAAFPIGALCIGLSLTLALLGCSGHPPNAGSPQPAAPESARGTSGPSPTMVSDPSSPVDSQATVQALLTQAPSVSGAAPTPTPTAWVPWLERNSYSFDSLDQLAGSDLSFFDRLLEGRRIVQLGESAHTTAEYSTAKVRLIQYLHEEHGYNVLAFESGLLGCYLTQQQIEALGPEEAMEGCVLTVWHTEEVRPLIEYLIESQSTSSPLTLAGFDIRPALTGAEKTTDFFVEVASEVDPAYAQEIEELDRAFIRGWRRSTSRTELHEQLQSVFDTPTPSDWYLALADFYEEKAAEIEGQYPDRPEVAELARRSAWSRAQFVRNRAVRLGVEQLAVRDAAMASNLEYLLAELYPEEKIIVWAHNGHISNTPYPLFAEARNMGALLAETHRDSLYTIGFFGYSVNPAPRLGTVATFRALPGSVEGLFHQLGAPIVFADLVHQQAKPGNEWMFRLMPMSGDLRLVPREHFDAIMFIDEVTGATYLSGDS